MGHALGPVEELLRASFRVALHTGLTDRRIKNRIKSYFTCGQAMRSTQQLSITLPIDMANALKEKVAAGTYASESEVIREGIRALLARDRAIESWLHQSIAPTLDATLSNPERSLSPSVVREHLIAEHHKAAEKDQ